MLPNSRRDTVFLQDRLDCVCYKCLKQRSHLCGGREVQQQTTLPVCHSSWAKTSVITSFDVFFFLPVKCISETAAHDKEQRVCFSLPEEEKGVFVDAGGPFECGAVREREAEEWKWHIEKKSGRPDEWGWCPSTLIPLLRKILDY